MHIHVDNITSLPVSCSGSVSLPASFALAGDSVSFSLKGDLTKTALDSEVREAYVLDATVDVVLQFDCQSCLDSVTQTISFDVNEMFCISGDIEKEIWSFSDDVIDLEPMLTANIIMQLPMKLVCSDDCKGLCPYCGSNLNLSSCQCADNVFDARFEKLRFLFRDKEV